MIVWLASYPRSGNSLLRSILYKTMGLKSYCWYEAENSLIRNDARLQAIGHTWYDSPKTEFMEAASESDRLFLVKTHELSVDDTPAIYVVRDGRSAISSFLHFEREHWPGCSTSMLRLILGEHAFGSWSDHCRAWIGRTNGKTLILKFPELVDCSPAMLTKVAFFLGYDGPISEWTEPLNEMKNNSLFQGRLGAASSKWVLDGEWDENCDVAFWEKHGSMMQELGFINGDAPAEFCALAVD
jgi:Sulfotransferase domain.